MCVCGGGGGRGVGVGLHVAVYSADNKLFYNLHVLVHTWMCLL